MAVSNALSTARSTHAGADPVPAMAAVDTAHEPSGKADHAQVHHHEQQDERDRDEEELLPIAARQRPRHGRRFRPLLLTASTPTHPSEKWRIY